MSRSPSQEISAFLSLRPGKRKKGASFARLSGGALAQAALHVGDRVKVWVSADYYDGVITEVGSGPHAGQYRIHFDKYANEQYALAKNVQPAKGAATGAKPRSAKCRIMVLNGLPVCDPGSVRR